MAVPVYGAGEHLATAQRNADGHVVLSGVGEMPGVDLEALEARLDWGECLALYLGVRPHVGLDEIDVLRLVHVLDRELIESLLLAVDEEIEVIAQALRDRALDRAFVRLEDHVGLLTNLLVDVEASKALALLAPFLGRQAFSPASAATSRATPSVPGSAATVSGSATAISAASPRTPSRSRSRALAISRRRP